MLCLCSERSKIQWKNKIYIPKASWLPFNSVLLCWKILLYSSILLSFDKILALLWSVAGVSLQYYMFGNSSCSWGCWYTFEQNGFRNGLLAWWGLSLFSIFVCNYLLIGTVLQYCIFGCYHYVLCLLSVESWIFPTGFLVWKTYALKKEKRQLSVIQSNASLPISLKLLIQ